MFERGTYIKLVPVYLHVLNINVIANYTLFALVRNIIIRTLFFAPSFFYILSCIECIHVSWCTTVRNKSIIIIIIIGPYMHSRNISLFIFTDYVFF